MFKKLWVCLILLLASYGVAGAVQPTAVPTARGFTPSSINCSSVAACTFGLSSPSPYLYFSGNGTAGNGGIYVGVSGSDTVGIMSWGSSTTSGGTVQMLAEATATTNSVTAACWGIFAGAGQLASMDCNGSLGLMGSITVTKVFDNELSSGRCVQSGTLGELTNTSAACATPPTIYTVAISTSGSCTAGSICTFTITSGSLPNGTFNGCTAAVHQANATPTPPLFYTWQNAAGPSVNLGVYNTTGSTITASTAYSVYGTCL